jgi:hypothetical protein
MWSKSYFVDTTYLFMTYFMIYFVNTTYLCKFIEIKLNHVNKFVNTYFVFYRTKDIVCVWDL